MPRHEHPTATVPAATCRTRADNDWLSVSSDDIFKGRRVVVFALPGACARTCSSAHVPRFNELVPVFSANDVDEEA